MHVEFDRSRLKNSFTTTFWNFKITPKRKWQTANVFKTIIFQGLAVKTSGAPGRIFVGSSRRWDMSSVFLGFFSEGKSHVGRGYEMPRKWKISYETKRSGMWMTYKPLKGQDFEKSRLLIWQNDKNQSKLLVSMWGQWSCNMWPRSGDQPMVNWWFWGPVVWIFGIPFGITGIPNHQLYH